MGKGERSEGWLVGVWCGEADGGVGKLVEVL